MQAYLLGTDTDRTRLRLTCHLGAALSEVNHRLGRTTDRPGDRLAGARRRRCLVVQPGSRTAGCLCLTPTRTVGYPSLAGSIPDMPLAWA